MGVYLVGTAGAVDLAEFGPLLLFVGTAEIGCHDGVEFVRVLVVKQTELVG